MDMTFFLKMRELYNNVIPKETREWIREQEETQKSFLLSIKSNESFLAYSKIQKKVEELSLENENILKKLAIIVAAQLQ